jgi:drug/metabolite transporter (DMT)-like permease
VAIALGVLVLGEPFSVRSLARAAPVVAGVLVTVS